MSITGKQVSEWAWEVRVSGLCDAVMQCSRLVDYRSVSVQGADL